MSGFIGTKLTMNLGERSYDIILKNGALENLYQFARLDRRVAVVTDAGVPAEYAQRVADQCRDAKIITVPQGETSSSPSAAASWAIWRVLPLPSICAASTSSTAPPPPSR